eukprot:2294947-Pleurochrysis_carterae.AAC.7
MGRGWEEKTKELYGAGGVCSRGPVATVYARRAGRLMKRPRQYLAFTNNLVSLPPVPTSDRHGVNYRFFARGILHRYFDFAAGRPTVLVCPYP